MLHENDVLLNITGASVARTCRLPQCYAGGRVNQHVAIIRPMPDLIDPSYLEHYLIAPQSKERLLTIAGAGATREAITKGAIEEFTIPVPPLPKQRRIAAILDEADALRARRRAALAQLDEMAQAIFVEMFGDLRASSQHWPIVPVSEVVLEFQGGKSLEAESDSLNASHYVLKISAVTSSVFRKSEKKPLPSSYKPPREHFVRQGDLLFSRANTTELVGAVALVEDTPDNLVLPDKLWRFVWRDSTQAVPLFMWALFQMPAVREEISRRATGTSGSMKNISQAKLLSMPIIRPALDLQRKFAERLGATKSLIDRQTAALRDLETLFSSLQHRAFRAEL